MKKRGMSTENRTPLAAYLIIIAAPAFFSTNLVFGRYVAEGTDPFLLAFVRWTSVAILLFPFAAIDGLRSMWALVRQQWPFLLLLSFLGMGISGSGVYLGLQSTTATNATLIYSISPILIILLERMFSGRRSSFREVLGIFVAFAGVAVIVLKGDLASISTLTINAGDPLILLAALSWAGYSILYKSGRVAHMSSICLFAVIALFGALINLPMAWRGVIMGAQLSSTSGGWIAIAGIILISSLLAFSSFQYGVRAFGASVAGLYMYLMTPYGVLMAVVFLGEKLQLHHYIGIACVMFGVAAATFPKLLLNKLRILGS